MGLHTKDLQQHKKSLVISIADETLHRVLERTLISKSIVGLDTGRKLLEGTAKMMVSKLAFIAHTQI